MDVVTQDLFSYVTSVFRDLHMHPEIGFDLPRTAERVSRELDAMGIEHTDRYGQCSIVAQIGHSSEKPTIGLRADMDALPVQEKTGLPYASKIDGVMHACGHDSHTAILLGVAKVLKENEQKLPCNVRFFFQPSEEGAVSGARMMVDNGCMEGVDAVICTHCEPNLPVGTVGVCAGDYMAACAPITLKFHGITSHATVPENGVDAVAMAVDAYTALKKMVKQEAGDRPYIWSVGHFTGGEVHNVIPDLCVQDISFRFYDNDFAERVHQNILKITEDIAASYGGKTELDWHVSTYAVHNDEGLVSQFRQAMSGVDGIDVVDVAMRRSSEDFAWYLTKKPGLLFRYGSGNQEKGCTASPHRPDFCIDEDGMKYAIEAFVAFVMNYHK